LHFETCHAKPVLEHPVALSLVSLPSSGLSVAVLAQVDLVLVRASKFLFGHLHEDPRIVTTGSIVTAGKFLFGHLHEDPRIVTTGSIVTAGKFLFGHLHEDPQIVTTGSIVTAHKFLFGHLHGPSAGMGAPSEGQSSEVMFWVVLAFLVCMTLRQLFADLMCIHRKLVKVTAPRVKVKVNDEEYVAERSDAVGESLTQKEQTLLPNQVVVSRAGTMYHYSKRCPGLNAAVAKDVTVRSLCTSCARSNGPRSGNGF
jgi:hypothetical protein